MLTRISSVDHVESKEVAFSSTFQIGDSSIINAFSRALAVQREAEIFFGDEGNFPSYPVFKKPLPLPIIDEPMNMVRHNLSPIIKVNNISLNAVAFSSVLHIGNSKHISLEVRIKHIRQLLPERH
ncbi:spore germination protein GerPE [Neobacillus kokaensis]|uniref:Spore germination protein GerPE n=1 Tax=Neobacillus kokaensis TaxID=2759023 RepID=A0ABQ3N4U6_9BACI|nr:spore germination protein GerPE [Neobacillus kokaensis]GHH98523.1 putative spore germination protein GerPE [Neobacillus kokaensis]